MTLEEEIQFKQKIVETILPFALNMTKEQIRDIIDHVQEENTNIPEGFGEMLLEQIMIQKYNKKQL